MRILIVNPFGIGDVIFSAPLIEALKKSYPDSFIGYVCNKRAYEVIKSNPNLNRIFVYEKDDYRTLWQKSKMEFLRKILDFLKTLKRERFDVAIDLSLGYQYSFLLRSIGVKRRIGFNYRDRGRFLTDKIDIEGFTSKHVIEYYLDVLKLLGIDATKHRSRPKTYITERDTIWADDFLKNNGINEGDLVIGVIPGCGASWGIDARFRRWGRKEFSEVCDRLIDRYKAKVILLGDSNEVEICLDIQGMMRNKAIIACGKTSLRDFIGLLSRCNLIVTNDGGPLHMAVSMGVKTVSIFGPVDEAIYGPYPVSPDHIVISKENMPCRPCYKKFKYNLCEERTCLKNIRPEDILGAVDTLLSKEGARKA
jgi:heptosyltransferase-2